MRVVITLVLGLAVLVLAAAFGTLNDQVVSVNYFLASRELKLAFLLAIAFGAGCVAGLLLAGGGLFGLRMEVRRARAELKLKDKELNELRTLPVRDAL